MSLTATRENADEVLSDPVLETFVDRLGALYAFVFHYMPIGRASLERMMTAEQRMWLNGMEWSLVRERHLFVLDFWNGATGSNGCIAGGRPGGYFHVNWNGDVSPCVFCPWSPVNVRDVYEAGGTLDDVWAHPFFAAIRRWQREYGYRESHEPCGETHDWIAPCLIRDHHADFQRIVAPGGVHPTDAAARAAQADPAWREGLSSSTASSRPWRTRCGSASTCAPPASRPARCSVTEGLSRLPAGDAPYFRVHSSSQPSTVSCHWMEFAGLRTQWFSSGKKRSFDGMPLRCRAVKVPRPCE